MSLKEDLEKIAKNEGFKTIELLVSYFIIKRSKTFKWLTEYIGEKHHRYYSERNVYRVCRPYIKIEKLKKLKRKRITGQISCNGFKSCGPEKIWKEKAKSLGFKGIQDMFKKWNGSDSELARRLNVTPSCITFRKRAAGFGDDK